MAYLLLIPAHAQIQWVQKGSDIDGENPGDNAGIFVDFDASGGTLAVGAHLNDDSGQDAGHVRIYSWNGSAWTQKGADIDGEAAGDWAGYRVKLSEDGNTLAIGATQNDGNGTDAGHVRVYTWSGTVWVQKGTDIDGEAAGDRFGGYIDMSRDANTMAISAYLKDGTGTDAGHVRVFSWGGSAWMQRGSDIDAETAGDNLSSVSLSADGNIMAVGARYNGGGASYAGHVRIFEWSGSSWAQRGEDIDGEAANDLSGLSVNLSSDGNTVSIGAYANDGGGTNAGHVRVFSWTGSAWAQKGNDIDGEAANDNAGLSESLSANGELVAVGASGNDGNGSNAGHARVYYACTTSSGTDVVTACDSYTWIDGTTYTESNNTATHTLTNAAGCDSTVTLDLTITHSTTSTDVVTACDSYTWVDGVTYKESNNTATYTLTNAAGCDSVVTLNLTLNTANAGVSQSGTTLTADAENAAYQWVDCDKGQLPLEGATGPSFTATAAGNYAVEVTENGCTKLSECITVVITGMEEMPLFDGASIFPNPNQGTVQIDLGPLEKASVKVYAISGRMVYRRDNLTNGRCELDLNIGPGIYIVELEAEGKIQKYKLVRQ